MMQWDDHPATQLCYMLPEAAVALLALPRHKDEMPGAPPRVIRVDPRTAGGRSGRGASPVDPRRPGPRAPRARPGSLFLLWHRVLLKAIEQILAIQKFESLFFDQSIDQGILSQLGCKLPCCRDARLDVAFVKKLESTHAHVIGGHQVPWRLPLYRFKHAS